MPDNKLTDNEIIKALECCSSGSYGCENGCPLDKECDSPIRGGEKIMKSALDLINRLQAKVIKEQNKNSKLRNERNRLQAENENYSKNNQQMTSDILKLYKELEQAKAENEKLEDYNENLQTANTALSEEILETKAEAYKEVEDKIAELFLRYAFLHSHADMARQDYLKAVDGTKIEMQSVWDVFTLKKYGIANYDEMNRLQTNIELIEKGRFLAELKKDFRLLVKELVGENNET